MDALKLRWLPLVTASGPENMAADEALLESAGSGLASLRFYRWSVPTVSLGYFQPAAESERQPLLAGLPLVRRATGGSALVHHFELTYALALPSIAGKAGDRTWLRMHSVIANALRRFGVEAFPFVPAVEEHYSGFLCFRHFTPGDLMIAGSKIVGSAQRNMRGAILQHGGILLAQSPHAPQLPGIRELTGRQISAEDLQAAIVAEFESLTGLRAVAGAWSLAELERIGKLVAEKYGNDAWTRKR